MASIIEDNRSLQTASPHGPARIPYGLGLLTTVASLPPKYRSRYLNIKTKSEIPLDLSVKQVSPEIISDVPIATSFTEVYTEPSPAQSHDKYEPEEEDEENLALSMQKTEMAIQTEMSNELNAQHQLQQLDGTQETNKPITPPPTPTNKRTYSQHFEDADPDEDLVMSVEENANPVKMPKTEPQLPTTRHEITPVKFIRGCDTAPKTVKNYPPPVKPSKNKATRRLKFDEETSSPVSGTIIRPLDEIIDSGVQYSNGDIDPKYNIVEVTEETKAELAAIRNVIGDYVCKLCRIKFDDAFCLARHRCACIVLLEYRCPDCGKQFNCPANLASHRRWHKPKKENSSLTSQTKENRNLAIVANKPSTKIETPNEKKPAVQTPEKEENVYNCSECGRKFKRKAYLRKHKLTHYANKEPTAPTGALQVLRDSTPTTAASPTSATVAKANSLTDFLPNYPNTRSSINSVSSRFSADSYEVNAQEGGDAVYTTISGYEYESDTMSEYASSNNSVGYGRLQIVDGGLTEEENIAAAALTNLRNCASVIQHTTLAH